MGDQKTTLLLILLYAPSSCVALTCLQCTESPMPRDCGKVNRCGPHQDCYIDKYISPSGRIHYDLGCRDVKFCTSTSQRRLTNHNNTADYTLPDDIILRSSGDVTVCRSCCTSDLCNNNGCGVTGYPTRQSRGPVCYTCAQQTSPESCDSVSVCGQNSICAVKVNPNFATGDVFYTSKCEDSQICHREVAFHSQIIGRKRLTEEVQSTTHKCVVKCCDDDLCNGYCGTTTSYPRTTVTYQGTTTAGHGTTTPSSSDPCASHPCTYGTCYATGSSYQCQCNYGYTGTNCSQVMMAQRDCSDLISSNQQNGPYTIHPDGPLAHRVTVFCEFNSDGAWTVIQRRVDASVSFDRTWSDYRKGFGNVSGNFWLGNDAIHLITSNGNYRLKVRLTDWNSVTKYAVYNTFKIGNARQGYKLAIGGYSGNAGDCMSYNNNRLFSTKDNDQDSANYNCATVHHGGGWWYGACGFTTLNGVFYPKANVNYHDGIWWYYWHGHKYSLKETTMMIQKI